MVKESKNKTVCLELSMDMTNHLKSIKDFLEKNCIENIYIVFYQIYSNATNVQKYKKIWGNYPKLKFNHSDTFCYVDNNDKNKLYYFSIVKISINEFNDFQFFINNHMNIVMFTSLYGILDSEIEKQICDEIFALMKTNNLFYKNLHAPTDEMFINIFSKFKCEYVKYYNDLNEFDITYFKSI